MSLSSRTCQPHFFLRAPGPTVPTYQKDLPRFPQSGFFWSFSLNPLIISKRPFLSTQLLYQIMWHCSYQRTYHIQFIYLFIVNLEHPSTLRSDPDFLFFQLHSYLKPETLTPSLPHPQPQVITNHPTKVALPASQLSSCTMSYYLEHSRKPPDWFPLSTPASTQFILKL